MTLFERILNDTQAALEARSFQVFDALKLLREFALSSAASQPPTDDHVLTAARTLSRTRPELIFVWLDYLPTDERVTLAKEVIRASNEGHLAFTQLHFSAAE
jgi:hypothetical protein